MSEGANTLPAGQLSVKEYLAILRRRKGWIILPAVAATLFAVGAALTLPKIWRSEAVILVEPQKVATGLLAPAPSSDLSDRIAMIRQQVMAQSRLKRLIDSLNLYPELRGKLGEQEIITKMQNDIAIEMVQQAGLRLNAFRIAYHGRNSVVVSQVANQLASEFIDENLKAREQQFYGTSEFLEDELAKTKKAIDEKDAQIRGLRSKYLSDLPESQQYHMEALNNLRTQLQSNQEQINRAQQDRMYLRSLASTSAPTVDLDAGTGASPYQNQLSKLVTTLADLRRRYGPEHPDVRRVQAQIDELNKKTAEIDRATPKAAAALPSEPVRPRNPVIEAQLAALDQQTADLSRAQQTLQKQISFHLSKLQGIPAFEQQVAGLMRDYDTLRARYQQLLDRKLAADTVTSLETRQKGERFVILDPAQVPEKPYGPKRALIMLAGLLGGVLGGLGLALVIDMSDESVRTEREASRLAGVPALGVVPLMMTAARKRRMYMRNVLSLAATAVVATGLGLAFSAIAGRYM